MKKVASEKYRDIDFSRAKRGAVVKYWNTSERWWTELAVGTTRP